MKDLSKNGDVEKCLQPIPDCILYNEKEKTELVKIPEGTGKPSHTALKKRKKKETKNYFSFPCFACLGFCSFFDCI